MGGVACKREIDGVTPYKTEHCELVCDSLNNIVGETIRNRFMVFRG